MGKEYSTHEKRGIHSEFYWKDLKKSLESWD